MQTYLTRDCECLAMCGWVGGMGNYNGEWDLVWMMEMVCMLILGVLMCAFICQKSLNHKCKSYSVIYYDIFLNNADFKWQEKKNYRLNRLPLCKRDCI